MCLCFNLEGLHENDQEFRSCIALDGNSCILNFITGTVADANGTITCDCFVLYEFDVMIYQGTAVAINKYTSFIDSNLNAK